MFERGFVGHHTPVLYQPVIQVPLLILEPGQQTRRDVFTPTSAVDVLPTLLKLTGHTIPDGLAGTVLPPYAGAQPDPGRGLFAVEAKLSTDAYHRRLDPVSVMMVKDKYKLVRYAGYKELAPGEALYELYDLQSDGEELNDLYASRPGLAAELTHELLEALQNGDQPQSG
jgi:arylsulfatase A-like enzyme